MIRHSGAARAFVVGWRDDAFQRPCACRAISGFGEQTEECLLQVEALGWAIDDLPIVQVAAPAQGDDAGADAAQRQPDLAQMLLIIAAKRGDVLIV